MTNKKTKWDVIIIGAGTAGIPAAVFSAARGANVLLVEQDDKIGGTLWYSGGQMAATGTKLHKERGIDDTPEEFIEDMRRISRNTFDEQMLGIVARESGATIDWLLEIGFEADPVCPAILIVHEPYMTKRSFWGVNKGISIIEALEPVLNSQIKTGKIKLMFSTEAKELIYSDKDGVTGIVAENDKGVKSTFLGSNILVTTGGYAANSEMFQKYSPNTPHYTATNPKSLGKGLKLLEDVNALIKGGENALPSYSCVLDDPENHLCETYIGGEGDALSAYVWLDTSPQSRPPWEIHVNTDGNRFVREDIPSVDEREIALMEQHEWRMIIIFDEGVRQNADPLAPLWSESEFKSAFDKHPSFASGSSWEELSSKININPDTLKTTVEEYNECVRCGKDIHFGREFLPKQLVKPPFYAISCVGMSVMSPAGVVTDEQLRVLDHKRNPIPNLYAAGEVMGWARLGGQSFVPGMSVTPALTFGRMLGQRILKWPT